MQQRSRYPSYTTTTYLPTSYIIYIYPNAHTHTHMMNMEKRSKTALDPQDLFFNYFRIFPVCVCVEREREREMAKKKKSKKSGKWTKDKMKKKRSRRTSVEMSEDDPILQDPRSPSPSVTFENRNPNLWHSGQICEWLEGTKLASAGRVSKYIRRTKLDGSGIFTKSFDSSGTVCGSITTDDLWIQIGIQKNERHLLATHILELLGSGLEDFYEWKRGYAPLLLFARRHFPRRLETFHRVAEEIARGKSKRPRVSKFIQKLNKMSIPTLDWLVQLQNEDLIELKLDDEGERAEILDKVNKLLSHLSTYTKSTEDDNDEGVLNLFEIAETGGELEDFKDLCTDINVNFKAVDQHGRSLVQLAIVGGNHEIVKFILEQDVTHQIVNWSHPSNSPELLASSSEDTVIKLHSNLAEAVHTGIPECVQAVVTARGFDLSSHYDTKRTMWSHAISQGYADIVTLLCRSHALSKSVEISSSESYPEDTTVIKLAMFQKHQLTVNIHGYGCPLVCAAASTTSSSGVMDVLLSAYTLGIKHGGSLNRSTIFDPNVQDPDGNTALMVACKCGHADQVKRLLSYSLRDEHGLYAVPGVPGVVATNLQNNLGKTALMIAAESGSESSLRELLNPSNLDIRLRMNDIDRRYLNRYVDTNAVR